MQTVQKTECWPGAVLGLGHARRCATTGPDGGVPAKPGGASDSVHRQSWVVKAVKGFFSGFSAFFALVRVVPELSASCSLGALDDEEFFVIEGSGVAESPGV